MLKVVDKRENFLVDIGLVRYIKQILGAEKLAEVQLAVNRNA